MCGFKEYWAEDSRNRMCKDSRVRTECEDSRSRIRCEDSKSRICKNKRVMTEF